MHVLKSGKRGSDHGLPAPDIKRRPNGASLRQGLARLMAVPLAFGPENSPSVFVEREVKAVLRICVASSAQSKASVRSSANTNTVKAFTKLLKRPQQYPTPVSASSPATCRLDFPAAGGRVHVSSAGACDTTQGVVFSTTRSSSYFYVVKRVYLFLYDFGALYPVWKIRNLLTSSGYKFTCVFL